MLLSGDLLFLFVEDRLRPGGYLGAVAGLANCLHQVFHPGLLRPVNDGGGV